MTESRRQKMFSGFGGDPPELDRAMIPPADPDSVQENGGEQHGSSHDQSSAPISVPPISPPKVTVEEPVSVAGKTVYVIDSHSLIYQVFHAMPEMTGPAGQPVGAIHGFIRDVLDILEKKKPDFLFCAFDASGVTFRNELYGEYKANRAEMPIDLRPQIADIQRMLTALGIPTLSCMNYEADDILATIAHQTESLGGRCVLVTGDKDCRQLITEQTQVYNIRKDELFDAAALEREWGIRPEQVVDFQSLVGDSVDNIPGVPLIGPKIAAELLRNYGTLENLFDHLDEVKQAKRRENLQAFREQALLSRGLVRLSIDTPVEIDWRSGQVGGVNREAAIELCREFGFRKLTDRIVGLSVTSTPAIWQAEYQAVTVRDHLQRLAGQMQQQRRLALSTLTSATSPRWAELIGIGVSWQEEQGYYIPLRGPQPGLRMKPEEVLEILRPILEDEQIAKVGQNLKHDLIVLKKLGVTLRGVSFDTMVADYLLDPGERLHTIDDLAKRYLNHTSAKVEDLIGSGKRQRSLADIPLAEITPYAAELADLSLRLMPRLQRRLVDDELEPLFQQLEMPLIEVLAGMEFHGIKVDTDLLGEMSERFAKRLEALRTEIFQLAGGEFNIDSPKQLSKVLFEDLQLPVLRKTKTGVSTDAEVLADLAKLHPLPAKIVEYRQGAKLKGTYIDALPQLVHPETGRVHTSFKQDVAATGRLSSTDPNLQNIPIRTEEGREIRSAFLPGEPGWLLLTADYSQIELRVLAHYSGDEALQRAFTEDRDIHTQVAAEVYGVTLAEVTRDMRRNAKAVNFGVIYGQSPFGLAKALDIDQQEAARFINTYFERYAGVAAFIRETLKQCRRQGYVSTISGRKRPVQGVRDLAQVKDPHQRTLPERVAINTVIQGSAADLIKQAMIQVDRRMRQEQCRARLLLQIHDELLFEFPEDERASLTELVVHEMTHAGNLSVPLKVDVKVGANWADCE